MDETTIATAERETIEDEAGLWLAKIDGRELTQDETRELLVWVRRSDFRREYLVSLAQQWDGMGALNKLATLFPISEDESSATSHGPRSFSQWLPEWLPQWSPALAMSLVLLALVLAWPPFFQPTQATYVTDVGETGRYLLSDGSTVTLNTNSELEIDYKDAQRKVILRRGEASFEVAKDPDRPFMVYAGSGVVQAVGTAFNVRFFESRSVDVIVTEGRISVIRQHEASPDLPALEFRQQQPALLDAGQFIQYSEAGELELPVPLEDEEVARRLAWQSGSLIFKGETLEQVIAEISRYTTKQLIIADASLNNLEVGGRYRTDDIDSLLNSLADVMNIDIRYLPSDKVSLSEKK